MAWWRLKPVPTKPFLLTLETTLKRTPGIKVASNDGEPAMNAIVANVLKREAAKAESNAQPFKIVALFCSVGLLASLCMASLGFDLGTGFF